MHLSDKTLNALTLSTSFSIMGITAPPPPLPGEEILVLLRCVVLTPSLGSYAS